MEKISNFFIITNISRDRDLSVTESTSRFLIDNGCTVTSARAGAMGDGPFLPTDKVPSDAQCIITIGGDGTLIASALDSADLNLPIIGINKGTLGYLTGTETCDIEETLRKVMTGDYTVEERMMLCGMVYDSENRLKVEKRALNDIVLKNTILKVSDYDISVNSKYLSGFKADGMIVCTPTGSTAYSMSAGGPIIEPMARMMVITPICPHTLNTRSIVISAEANVVIEVRDDSSAVLFDGRFNCSLSAGDRVTVRSSSKVTRIIKTAEDSFLSVLGKKFRS